MSPLALIAVVTTLAAAATAPSSLGQTVSPAQAQEAVKHYRAGKEALTHERFDEAEQEFRLAAKLDPLLVAAHHGLGQTMMATKRYPEAVEAFRAAREAFTEGQALAATNEMATQRRLDDQIKALQDDVRSAQGRASGSGATGVQSAIARNQDQIKTLQSLRRRGSEATLPTPHWLSFALGSAYFRAGDPLKAEQEYRAAIAQKSDLGEGHLNLAVVCMLTGRLDEADREVALAEKAGTKVPQGLKDDIQKRRQAQP